MCLEELQLISPSPLPASKNFANQSRTEYSFDLNGTIINSKSELQTLSKATDVQQYLPSLVIGWRLKNKRVLLVGCGKVGTSRLQVCLEAGAHVRVVAPDVTEEADKIIANSKNSVWVKRLFDPSDILDHSIDLVLSTIDDGCVSEKISSLSRSRKIPVSCADKVDLCDFWFMSTFREGPLQISVSTNGNAPRLGSIIKSQIKELLPSRLGDAVANVGIMRKLVKQATPKSTDSGRRMKWLSQFCNDTPINVLASLSLADVHNLIQDYKANKPARLSSPRKGKHGLLSLVGAGTGALKLLTLEAREVLESADLVLADELVSSEILKVCKGKVVLADKHMRGQDPGQSRLNRLGLEALEQGRTVVRLKTGDPFVFGRGGDEILFFRQHGFEARVVPGISSALVAPLSALIPVTHRGVTDQVLVLSAHLRNGAYPDIPSFSETRTLIFLMTVRRLQEITRTLLIGKSGYPADFPAAVIENATTVRQREFYGTLSTISDIANANELVSPSVLIVSAAVPVLRPKEEVEIEEEEQQEKSAQTTEKIVPQVSKSTPAAAPSPVSSPVGRRLRKLTSTMSITQEVVEPVQEEVLPQEPLQATATRSVARSLPFTDDYLAYLNAKLKAMSLPETLLILTSILPDLWQITSFGASGMVIIDHLSKLNLRPNIIFLDTLHHFPETIRHANAVAEKYKLSTAWYHCEHANTKDQFTERFGDELWERDPSRYDWLVKVEPLERALHENNVKAWITGRRRSQGGERGDLSILEFDPDDGRLKVNPLAHWSFEEVWTYIKNNEIPYNELYDKGYGSIGDVHSTRPSKAGQERSGRFFNDSQKTECGIHSKNRPRHLRRIYSMPSTRTPA